MPLIDPRSNEHAVNKLQSASIVGHTDSTSCRLWVRVYKKGNWYLVWSESPFSGDLKSLPGKLVDEYLKIIGIPNQRQSHDFDESTDLTHTFELTGLKPDTIYYYAVMSDDCTLERQTEIGYDKPLWFRTMPEAMTSFTFGFYSCHDPFNANGSFGAWPLFQNMLERYQARFVIGGGDQIYVDCQEKKWFPDIWEWLRDNKDDLVQKIVRENGSFVAEEVYKYLLDLYRWYYRVYWQFPHVRAIFARYPQYMIWDDHEIMDGWGSRTKKERINHISRYFRRDDPAIDSILVEQMWRAALKAYKEYEHSHNPVTQYDPVDSVNCHWDYSFYQGGIPFYVLDQRGHHDVERATPDKLLGAAQFTRFCNWLKNAVQSGSRTLFVVLPVPIVHWSRIASNIGSSLPSSKDDCMDEWEHKSNQVERRNMLDTIFAQLEERGQTLIFLSGDVHSAAVFKLSHQEFRQARVFQVTSSAISRLPAGMVASMGIAGSGAMTGAQHIHQERLFSQTANKNFAMVHVSSDHSVSIDLCWPGENLGESVIKTITLDQD